MVDNYECNEIESKKILDFYLREPINIISIHRIGGVYYMTCTTPYMDNENMRCDFHYNVSGTAHSFSVWKNSRVYSLYGVKEISEEFDNACKEAIRKYEEKRSLNFPEGLSFGKKEERLMTKDRKILFAVLFLYFLTLLGVYLYLF